MDDAQPPPAPTTPPPPTPTPYWAPSSPGDLADRWTILQLKLAKCPETDHAKRDTCVRRLRELPLPNYDATALGLVEALARINSTLWDLEDTVRRLMAQPDGPQQRAAFIRAARAVPILNDTRAHLKMRLDQLCGYDGLQDPKMYA